MAGQGIGDPLTAVRRLLCAAGAEAYVVGGRVRDAVLDRSAPPEAWSGGLDTDVVVRSDAVGHAAALARALHGTALVLDQARDMARVVWADATLDLARMVGPHLDADLGARDFTINAMAVPLAGLWPPTAGQVIDPTGGLADLAGRTVRMTTARALDADPLRMLRAVRFACQLDFTVEARTREAIRDRAAELRRPARERVRDELVKTLATPLAARGVRDLAELGLLGPVLPEVAACRGVAQRAPHTMDVLEHTLLVLEHVVRIQAALDGAEAAVDAAVAGLLRRFERPLRAHLGRRHGSLPRWLLGRAAALLHDVGKPALLAGAGSDGGAAFAAHGLEGARLAATAGRRLRLSGRDVHFLQRAVAGHLLPLRLVRSGVTPRRVFGYYETLGSVGVDVALLSLADNAAKPAAEPGRVAAVAAVAERLLADWFEHRDSRVSPLPLLTGSEIMVALDISAGPAVGRLSAALREAQAAGEVRTRAQALAFVRQAHRALP